MGEGGAGGAGERQDFFISHAGTDAAWAEWVAWQLIEAGYTVKLDLWDWAAGQNFITSVSDALDQSDRVVALFSATYFDRSRYTTEERTSAVLHVPGKEERRLIPLRAEDVPATKIPAVLRTLLYRDLFGVTEERAREVVLEAVAGPQRAGVPALPRRGYQPARRLDIQ